MDSSQGPRTAQDNTITALRQYHVTAEEDHMTVEQRCGWRAGEMQLCHWPDMLHSCDIAVHYAVLSLPFVSCPDNPLEVIGVFKSNKKPKY